MATAARKKRKMLDSISGLKSSISTSARALSPTASPYHGRRGAAERKRRVTVGKERSISWDERPRY
jgi:hypothetical protein